MSNREPVPQYDAMEITYAHEHNGCPWAYRSFKVVVKINPYVHGYTEPPLICPATNQVLYKRMAFGINFEEQA